MNRPLSLYPGDGKPAIALYWMSSICAAIKEQLDVVPSAFHSCTSVLSYEQEIRARDCYWQVVLHEEELSYEKQRELLQESIARNPFIAEPEVMLGQLLFRRGDLTGAGEHSARALRKMYALGSAWDKRLSYATWVAYARVLLVRSQHVDGALPVHDTSPVGTSGRQMVDLNELVELM